MDTLTALVLSFVFAGIMIYVIDKYFGRTDDSEPFL
jgi:hypothetical protein